MTLEFHPLANLFPLIEGADFDELVADVKANGLVEPIDVYQGKILDGRNRARACEVAEIEIERHNVRLFRPELMGDPLAYVISKNLRRRHLDDRQRTSIAGKIANLGQGGDRSKPPIGGMPVDKAAVVLNVAPRGVERARVVHSQGVEEVRVALDRGQIAVSAAESIARLPEQEQAAAVAKILPNASRAIAPSRQEPDDSADFFPTPPWGTRALIERVFSQLGVREIWHQQAWEPACGAGHMAEVLKEYFREVLSTDILDYGYGDRLMNFLQPTMPPLADWIITNPPFGDKTEEFVLRALDLAKVGVAMFVRLQWLETIGRYERLFRDRPPTLISFFCERVPLCKNKWKPDGSTLTSYIWLVWLRGHAPRAPFWIPPGCRKALTRAADAVRFTTHPVTKRARAAFTPAQLSLIDANGMVKVSDTHTVAASFVTEDEWADLSSRQIAAATKSPAPVASVDLDIPARLRRGDDGKAEYQRVSDPETGEIIEAAE